MIKCPHPPETFQWLLLCSESCVCKHGLIGNNLTCHEARGGQVTGNHPPKRTNNKVDKFVVEFDIINKSLIIIKETFCQCGSTARSITLDKCSTGSETRRECFQFKICIFNTSLSIEANFVKYWIHQTNRN